MLTAVIDIEVVFTQKADEDDVEFFRNLHGKARWSPNRCYHRQTAHQGFLQQLKAGPPRKQKQAIPQWCSVRKELCAEQLIHRIVTAYIFAKRQQIARGIEEACTVQSPGPIKHSLRLTEAFGQTIEKLRVHFEIVYRTRRANCAQGKERRFATDAAA
jgi:hypothetical protein